MPKEAKRRFVGLKTQEVSLVDSPANEVEFLVVKNQEEDRDMGATAETKKERVPVKVEEEDGDDGAVTKALAHVDGIIDKIHSIVTKKESKAPNSDSAEASADEAGAGSGDDADEDTGEIDTTKATVKSILEKCGMNAGQVKSALAQLKAAGFAPGSKKGKTKADDDDDDEEEKTSKSEPADDEPLTMASLASAVQKAAVFTPSRIKALQDVQETLKLMLEAVAPGTSPDSNVPAIRTHSNQSLVSDLLGGGKKSGVPTKKSVDGGDADEGVLITTLKSLADAVGNLNTRIETIEKARGASNSLEPEGTTDTTTKKSTNLWSGVL